MGVFFPIKRFFGVPMRAGHDLWHHSDCNLLKFRNMLSGFGEDLSKVVTFLVAGSWGSFFRHQAQFFLPTLQDVGLGLIDHVLPVDLQVLNGTLGFLGCFLPP